MRTAVTLESVGALVEGRHENPFELLGPHEIECDGSKAVAVRAYLPHSTQAWVLPEHHQDARPMRRIHPSGLFEAICPWTDDPHRLRYQLRVADEGGQTSTNRLGHDASLWPVGARTTDGGYLVLPYKNYQISI